MKAEEEESSVVNATVSSQQSAVSSQQSAVISHQSSVITATTDAMREFRQIRDSPTTNFIQKRND